MSKNLCCTSIDITMQLLFVDFQEILLVGIGIMLSKCLDLPRSLLIAGCNSLLSPYLPWFRQMWLILILVHVRHIWCIYQLLICCVRWLCRDLLRHWSCKGLLLLCQWLLACFSLWFTTHLPVIFQARGGRSDVQVFLIDHCNLFYTRLIRNWSWVLLLYFDISRIIWPSLIWFWSILIFGSSALSRLGIFQWVNNLIAYEAIFSIRTVPDSSLMSTISYPERWSNSLKWWLILQSHSLSFQLNWANKLLLLWVISAALVARSLHYQVTGSMHHGQPGVASSNLSLEAVDVLAMGLVLVVLNAWLHEVNSLKHHDVVFDLLCLLLFTYKIIQWIFIILSWWLKSEPSTGYVWIVHHFQFALAQCTWSLNVANVD